jgi:hypothetical protein
LPLGTSCSPYTITVGAVLKDESLPWFAELCAAQLACAFGADLSSASGGIVCNGAGRPLTERLLCVMICTGGGVGRCALLRCPGSVT